MMTSDALQAHISGLKSSLALSPVYVFSGDEPLLMMEAMDQLRSVARTLGYTEREVLMHERYFDW